MSASVTLSHDETMFVARAVASAWVLDIEFGSGEDLVDLMQQLSLAMSDGCEIDPSKAFGLCNLLAIHDTGNLLTEEQRDALVARVKEASK